ncbi:MAG: ABC transporter permease [Thiotrichales bacterium]|nr:ABC transporter permease [Thiotrichales bacterium]
MQNVETIPLINLSLAFIPVAVVVWILFVWSLGSRTAMYSVFRMLIQLLLIGYVLTYIFESNESIIVILVLAVMLLASSWIALRPLKARNQNLYLHVLVSISLGGITTLALITGAVLQLNPWFAPHMMIPLAGMIFANAMNTVSVAAERFESESCNRVAYLEARQLAMRAAMIPVINSMFAVGLVSLPGMMTGQILSGVSPLIAVRYQIMVMCMIFGSSGIAAACYLWLQRSKTNGDKNNRL